MKRYGFYGWQTADIREKHGLTPRDCYDLLSGLWCAGTCAPRMREKEYYFAVTLKGSGKVIGEFFGEPEGTALYENTCQYAILKKEWDACKPVPRCE